MPEPGVHPRCLEGRISLDCLERGGVLVRVSAAVKQHEDNENSYKGKKFHWSWPTILEVWSTIVTGNMTACRLTWC